MRGLLGLSLVVVLISSLLPLSAASGQAEEYTLVVSTVASRSDSLALDGATVTGDIYAFTTPDTSDIDQVRFWIDDPARDGPPTKTENTAPYDLGGGSVATARPFDTTDLADGTHTLTAEIDRGPAGTDVVTATFTIANTAQPPSTSTSTTTTSTTSTSTTVPPGQCSDSPPLLPAVVTLPFATDFASDRGGLCDGSNTGTGFTVVDEPSSGDGYLPDRIAVTSGELALTTTPGLMLNGLNTQDNALAVGVAPPDVPIVVSTSVVEPDGSGGYEQGGIWFGNDEEHHLKLVVLNWPGGNWAVQLRHESADAFAGQITVPIADPSATTVDLELTADPATATASARYRIADGGWQEVGALDVAVRLFTQDQAGVGELGTSTFAGVFASHRQGPSPLVYRFDRFSVEESSPTPPPPPPPGPSEVAFDAVRTSVGWKPSSLVYFEPLDRYYALDVTGVIRELDIDSDTGEVAELRTLSAVRDRHGDNTLSLGLAVDPGSTASNLVLWVSHAQGFGATANGDASNPGVVNSSTISRLPVPASGTPDAGDVADVITGLPRAFANHSINSIRFGPDGRLYVAHGGQTGAGGANTAPTEFSTRPEQYYSAAVLVADVNRPDWDPAADGDCATDVSDSIGIAQKSPAPDCSVELHATGFRNMYDIVHHTNGYLYGADNGLGVEGTVPLRPAPDCQGIVEYDESGDDPLDPGPQPDRLHRIEPGGYYGHPNPARDECVFFDGSFQGVGPPPSYRTALYEFPLTTRSHNSIIEYRADRFGASMQGDLLVTSFAGSPQGVRRIQLTASGDVASAAFLPIDFPEAGQRLQAPLPLVEGRDGIVVVGEFIARTSPSARITVLVPSDEIGAEGWSLRSPVDADPGLLDAGSAVLDNRLYAVGGKTSASNRISAVRSFDPSTDDWSLHAPLPGPGREDPATVAHGGSLFAFGGATSSPFVADVTMAARYDPVSDTWDDAGVSDLSQPVTGAAAVSWEGAIWLLGGLDATGTSMADVLRFDPEAGATGSWSAGPSLPAPRDNAGAAVVDGDLYVFGGRDRSGSGGPTYTTVWRLASPSGGWEEMPAMPAHRRSFVVGSAGGSIQLFGGESGLDSAIEAVHEFEPGTGTWSALPSMPTGRHGAFGGTIAGVTYVVGGATTSGASAITGVNEAYTR